MEFVVLPEPDPDERKALAIALERLLAGDEVDEVPQAYRSRWRATGIAENLDDEPSD